MRIESFSITNYRSIKNLRIDNLNEVTVFFGKNNVGKSNILRGLHLAFYSLKEDDIFLPDTMFYNRNIYRPIQIAVNLTLGRDFVKAERVSDAISKEIENVAHEPEISDEILLQTEEFLGQSRSFAPLRKLRLKVHLDYNDERCEVGVLAADTEAGYEFDYGKYKRSYEKLENSLRMKTVERLETLASSIVSDIASMGPIGGEAHEYLVRVTRDLRHGMPSTDYLDEILGRLAERVEGGDARHYVRERIRSYREAAEAERKKLQLKPFSKIFNIVREYFGKISDSFILVPNKEYFPKGPLTEKKSNGKQIEIFDLDRFDKKLLSLIESPSKKERLLIEQFNSLFTTSFGDLGEIEIRKFRQQVFAIFDTGLTALPIENQGLGVQDLFLYLACMILFDPAIIAIEEPEGGLSSENQRVLHQIIQDVYSQSQKQIFISSHSEEFESPRSYIIEMGSDGTKEISRVDKEKEYEEKIDAILIKRKLEEEKKHYQALLQETAERQMTLDVLNYIHKLPDKEALDAEKISADLGYKKEKVQQILKQVTRRK